MKISKIILASIVLIALTSLTVATSQAQPTGSITNLITGATNVIWDLSQLTNELQNLHLDITGKSHGSTNHVEVLYADPFTQDGKGKLAGQGSTSVELILEEPSPATNNFPGTYISKGSLTSSKGVTRAVFNSKVAGSTTFPGDSQPTAVSASANYIVTFNAVSNTVSGRSVERASAARKGSLSEKSTFNDTISSLMDELGNGTWTLVLDFAAPPAANKLAGTASVTLNSGAVYPFNFTGVYTPRTGASKLNLKGHDAGAGSILQVMLSTNHITRIVGRVTGQSVNIKQ